MAKQDFSNLPSIMKKVAEQAPVIQAAVMRNAAQSIATEAINHTPVDTGTARSNWRVAINSPDLTFTPGAHRTVIHSAGWGRKSRFRRAETALKMAKRGTNADYASSRGFLALNRYTNAKEGDTIFITNTTPYIERLDQGWSKQAPRNFVGRAVEVGIRRVGGAKITLV